MPEHPRKVVALVDAGVPMDRTHSERSARLHFRALSRHPVVFSHAMPLAPADPGHKVADEQTRACAATGGVVCISGVSSCHGCDAPSAHGIARHMAHAADPVGVQRVGLGWASVSASPRRTTTHQATSTPDSGGRRSLVSARASAR